MILTYDKECQLPTIAFMRGRASKIYDKIGITSEHNCWIAGGYIRDSLVGVRPKDVDIFFANQESFNQVDALLKAKGAEQIRKNPNSITYELEMSETSSVKIDVIHGRFLESPDSAIESFDFTVACGYISSDLTIGLLDTMLLDLPSKSLRVNKLVAPESTLRRIAKYVRKGYRPCEGTLLEIYRAIVPKKEEENQDQADYKFLMSID